MFIEVPAQLLKSIASRKETIPKLYYHPIPIVRKIFWLRLEILYGYIQKYMPHKEKCIDFGCGSGVFLPSLASSFNTVLGIDVELAEAKKVIEHYRLNNVTLLNNDIYELDLAERTIDAICAADVLEHFKDLDVPVTKIMNWLKKKGFLLTSLPTENICTRITRTISCTPKPFDHYHSAQEVEQYLLARGFKKVETSNVLSFMPLYKVTIWENQ